MLQGYNIYQQCITGLQKPSRLLANLRAVLLMILFPAFLSAQPLLTTSSSVEGDFIIPTGINAVTITATGGDGGDAITLTTCRYFGGRAARVAATFSIYSSICPTGQFNLVTGGRLRFVRGKNGRDGSEGGQFFPIGCGGGGAAVLYQAPGTTNWIILLVAGGGGGAHANRGQLGNQCFGGNGFNANLTENGTNGGGTNGGGGGANGIGGNAGGIIPGDGGGGGGAFGAGGNGSIAALGGGSGFPAGGVGGIRAVGGSFVNGGNGFGAGGARYIGGGGGGGFSGGGGGSLSGYGAGGGGGTFVAISALNIQKSITGANLVDGGSIATSLILGTNALPVSRLYVDKDAVGSNNGTTWANAYIKLQDALAATSNLCRVDIWVANGTYYPDEGIGFTNNNRTASFAMRSGVALYGGFAGNEAQFSQRNFLTNQTILSGDLLQNNNNYSDAQFANYADNAFHVVKSENTNSTAILNGFIIHSGNANGSSFPNNSGGGIYSTASGTQISNCTVYFNQAVEGGGLYNNQSSPTISNCIFKSNKVVVGAAGVYVRNNSYPFFYNCVFQANYVGTTTPDGGGGGAILNADNSAPEYINCTVSGNFANTGGAVYNLNNAKPIFYNSIIWQNKSSTDAVRISSDASSSMTYRNCLVQGINLSGSLGNLNGSIISTNVFTLNDVPDIAPQAIGILSLARCSPAINNGSNGYLANPTDIAGNPRFVNTIVDLGAYELQLTDIASRLFVNAAAVGTNNGSSWGNAFTKLQDALAFNCGGIAQIWVAKGTYKPTVNNSRDDAFVLKNNLAIYGGFAGTETLLSQRNWRVNPTILSGDIGLLNNYADNSYNVIRNVNNGLNNTAVLDGCTITGGNANKADYFGSRGGAVHNLNSAPAFYNCIFSGNNAAAYGGAMFNQAVSPLVVNSLFTGNTAQYGGGLYNESAATRIINCSFAGNQVTITGAAMYTFGTVAPQITNSILWGNSSGIQNAGGAVPTVTNSIVQGGYSGAGNLNLDPLFILQPTPALGSTGDLRLLGCSPAVNAGSNAALPAGVTADLGSFTRIANGTVDMGAYERQTTATSVTVYVDSSATGNNSGESWANAYKNFSSALIELNFCTLGTTIQVAKGTYTVPLNTIYKFDKSGAIILGGYPTGGGTTRNSTANRVILKGNVQVFKSLRIDGFEVQTP